MGVGVLKVLRVVGVHLQRHAESRPGVGPAGVEGSVGEDGGHFLPGHAILLSCDHVMLEGGIGHSLSHQCGHRENGAHFLAECVIAPHFSEQHVVVQGGELGREGAERIAAGGLDYFGHGDPFR